jgi:hypothetical protein
LTLRCPHCEAAIGGSLEKGGHRIRGLAIMLVDDDGRVHGPCRECRGDVTISTGGDNTIVKSSSAVKDRKPAQVRRRLVINLDAD